MVLIPVMSFAKASQTGSTPSGWTSGYYGNKGNPIWKVEKGVLKQTGVATYSWLVKDQPMITDGSIEVDLQVLSGKEDPEAGLVWRHIDGKNYYYVRVNSVEDNLVFYRMNKGNKEVVKVADTKIPFKTWHHLKIDFHGELTEVLLNGKQLISVRDTVFSKPGHVGLFTTADTVRQFDHFNFTQEK